MNEYSNVLTLAHGGDTWDAVREALDYAAANPAHFKPNAWNDICAMLNAMDEIEGRAR